jgi:hypothetical protein
MKARAAITVRPLRPARWADFATLFGECGVCGVARPSPTRPVMRAAT